MSPRTAPSKNSAVQARRSVLLADGTIAQGARPRMEEEFLLEALRWMMKSRLYDQKVIALQRQGLFGVYSPGIGQEACIIGSAMAVDPVRDWMVPQYRELMATVHHGLPLEVITAQYLGKIGPARIHVRGRRAGTQRWGAEPDRCGDLPHELSQHDRQPLAVPGPEGLRRGALARPHRTGSEVPRGPRPVGRQT